jgi:hypothetical protein
MSRNRDFWGVLCRRWSVIRGAVAVVVTVVGETSGGLITVRRRLVVLNEGGMDTYRFAGAIPNVLSPSSKQHKGKPNRGR